MKKVIALVAAIALAGCQAPRAESSPTPAASGTAGASATPNFAGRSLNVVTGGTGGVYIVYGAGLATILNAKLGTAASAQSTAASVDNLKLIGSGKADLAFTLSDIAFAAVNGKDPFTADTKVNARALAVLYTNYMHLVVKDGIGINGVADLRGKRVSVGAAGSGTEVKANRVLEADGLAQKDLQVQKLGVQDSANALRDGKLDAFFWDGGLPTAAVLDLVNSGNVSVKFIDQSAEVRKMADKYGPYYFPATIPANTYKNDKDISVAGVANLLVVPATFDPALAKAILATMFDNKADLEKIHAEAKNLKLDTAVKGSPIDFLPGAIDFYKERGVWK